MAVKKRKWTLTVEGFDGLTDRLRKLDGNIKNVAEEALTDVFDIVTPKAQKAIEDPNLPAKGDYSVGDTEKSSVRRPNVEWTGTIATIPVGFRIGDGGLASVFLMKGTPRMKPARGLYAAFYGTKTRKESNEAIQKVFYDAVRRLER